MTPKEMRNINKRIQKFKERVKPVNRGRVAGRIRNERNQQKRFSRRMRGIQ